MKRRTVISMEQALSLSYATLRFVQLGWRVIRLESTPIGTAQDQWHTSELSTQPVERQ